MRALVGELGTDIVVQPTLETAGGVVLESAGGRTIKNTFQQRLLSAEPQLRLWYGRRLDALQERSLCAVPVGDAR